MVKSEVSVTLMLSVSISTLLNGNGYPGGMVCSQSNDGQFITIDRSIVVPFFIDPNQSRHLHLHHPTRTSTSSGWPRKSPPPLPPPLLNAREPNACWDWYCCTRCCWGRSMRRPAVADSRPPVITAARPPPAPAAAAVVDSSRAVAAAEDEEDKEAPRSMARPTIFYLGPIG